MLFSCGLLLFCWIPVVSLQDLKFTIEPKSVIVRNGSPVILNCQTNIQTTDIIIQWKKGYNGLWIHDYKNKPYQLLRNYSLYFPSVGTGDEDVYFCAAYRHGSTAKTIYSKAPAHITLAYITTTFIASPMPPEIREHDTATLSCISGASQPLPSVTWEKNGRPITDKTIVAQHYLLDQNATSGTLQLKNLSILVDTGYYRCIATNPLLPDEPKKSQKAFLKVLPLSDEPRIEVHPVNTISPRRHPVRLDCIVVGNPTPVVFWLRNNIRVVNTSNRVVYPNGSLAIHSLTLDDNGQYSCNGTNSKGTVASTGVFLNAAYIDFNFKRNPENETAVNGSRVEMICESPDHFPINAIRYSWYKAFKRIALNGRVRISSSGNLVFSPVLKSDEGVYFCEVSLSKEFSMKTRASIPAYLTVNVPPYFLTKPSDRTVVLGQTLRLSCKATGFPKPSLTWYHGTMLLRNTSRLTLGADGSLVLNEVDIDDEGQYRCETQNVAGDNVAVATITVHAPPNGTVMPKDTSAVLRDNATFMCRFAGNPPPVTLWYFKRANDRAVLIHKNSSRYIQNQERLSVLNVTEADNGLFICVGENIVGAQNFSATLAVQVPARFEISPRNTTVNESDVAEITCRGYGNPRPNVTWSMDGIMLSNDSRITIVGGKLSIRNVRRNDTGIYSCTVKNYVKREKYSVENLVKYSVYLTVQVFPSIREITGPSRVRWKHNVTFSCESDGVPTPRIMWYKNMRKIPYTSGIYARGSELHIVSSENNDTGNYTCEASNLVGSTKTMRRLIVEVSPSEPFNVKLGGITSTSLRILWQTGFDGYSPVTLFRLEIRRNSSLVWRNVSEKIKTENYTVHGLRPYTVYHVRVFARNKIGWSGASRSVWSRTAEDAPSSPNNPQCQTISSSTIQLTWNKPSQPNGKLRKYRIQYSNYSNRAIVSTSSTSYRISGLRPFTWYKFRVQAATGKLNVELLWGNYSSYVSCRSGEAAPVAAPRNFTVVSSGPHSILARWQTIPIGSENGIVTGYYIQYKKNISLDVTYTKILIGRNDTLHYNITRLSPWTEYVIQVAAMTVTMGPWSIPRTSKTMESVPSGQPNNVIVNARTSSSLSVDWDPPLSESQNGVIRGYTVLYGVADFTGVKWNLTTNKTSVELSGLTIFTSYIVQIRAFTAVGFGPYTVGIVKKTLESYPSPVTGLSENITETSVILYWQPPHTPNGIITAYTTFINTTTVHVYRRPETNITMYNVTSRSREIITNVTQVVLTGFYGNITYSVCVAARTSVGYGPCSRNLVFTTNFTKKVIKEKEEFTSSIIDDHLPLIAGGAAVLFALLIALFVCCFIKRKNRKKEEKETQQTFNFQRSTFPMRSFDDGESSSASHGSKPIHAYSVESSSIHSRTNPSNAFASPESHDGSPLVRLRNNSLALGSDASSYDAPYSSVDEIGVDPKAVVPVYTVPHSPGTTRPRQFVNALYTERELEDTRGETGSQDSYVQYNPVYQPNYPQVHRPESGTSPFENFQEDVGEFPEGEGPLDVNDYAVLVLPPPPLEYSDYGEDTEFHSEENDETLHAYSNAVTDF